LQLAGEVSYKVIGGLFGPLRNVKALEITIMLKLSQLARVDLGPRHGIEGSQLRPRILAYLAFQVTGVAE
jgi:hypothetical protein